jgi:hypothetical protein
VEKRYSTNENKLPVKGMEKQIFQALPAWIYKTTILPLVLYGCETWSLTIKEEHRLRVFEKREENIWIEERWNVRRLENCII